MCEGECSPYGQPFASTGRPIANYCKSAAGCNPALHTCGKMNHEMALFQTARQLRKMKKDWDRRARENARHYVETAKEDWTDEEFFQSGETTVEEEVDTDMTNICQGKDPRSMLVLEIGCGPGRVTRALAKRFGEVHSGEVSGEMVKLATSALAQHPYAYVCQDNGKDLGAVPEREFELAV